MSVDTVRYYVRRGLLTPSTGTRGGRNPYQVFTEADLRGGDYPHLPGARVEPARDSRLSGRLPAGRLDDAELVEYLQRQQDRLRRKADELSRLVLFLDTKICWIRRGKIGIMPSVADFVLMS